MLQRTSLPEQVFTALVTEIVGDRYPPGHRLPPQRALARDLDVNLASIREGIKRLEQLNLVDVRQGDATYVRDWRGHGGLEVLAYAAAADPSVTKALFEARRLLLREAARLAADRRTDEHAETLTRLAGEFATAEDAQVVDLLFMVTLIAAADNLVFSLIMNSVRDLYAQRLDAFAPIVGDRAALAPLYGEAARAIEVRDGGAAAAAIEALAAAQERAMLS